MRGSDLIDGEVADHRHVGCAVALAQPGLVFVEDDVENPVQSVFDRIGMGTLKISDEGAVRWLLTDAGFHRLDDGGIGVN